MLFLNPVRSLLCSPLQTQASVLQHAGPSLVRFRHQLAPRRVTFIKRHKGIIPIPTGGSVKGTTLAYGEWGIRIKGDGVRLTAKQLTSAEEVIKRKIKPVKGARVFLRVFPDIPVCIKARPSVEYGLAGFFADNKYREMRLVWERGRVRLNIGQRGKFLCVAYVVFKSDVLMVVLAGCQQDASFLRSAEHQSVRS